MKPEISVLVGIALEASSVVLDVYNRSFSVDYKGPDDPVTEADRCANELICRRLNERYPGIPVVAEESKPEEFADYRESEHIFFVDPVDGTRDFVLKNGEFVVMIGFVSGDRATMGVLHSPTQGMTWVGDTDYGAFSIDANGKRNLLHVSSTSNLASSRAVASRSHRSQSLDSALSWLAPKEQIILGSTGLRNTLVAKGEVDFYYAASPRGGKLWDVCAPDALVTSAGGVATDEHGARFDYRATDISNSRGLLTSNFALHQTLVDRLRAYREQA